MVKKRYPKYERKSPGIPLIKRYGKERFRYAHVTRRSEKEANKIAKNMRKEGWKVRVDEQKSLSFDYSVYRLYKKKKKKRKKK